MKCIQKHPDNITAGTWGYDETKIKETKQIFIKPLYWWEFQDKL